MPIKDRIRYWVCNILGHKDKLVLGRNEYYEPEYLVKCKRCGNLGKIHSTTLKRITDVIVPFYKWK